MPLREATELAELAALDPLLHRQARAIHGELVLLVLREVGACVSLRGAVDADAAKAGFSAPVALEVAFDIVAAAQRRWICALAPWGDDVRGGVASEQRMELIADVAAKLVGASGALDSALDSDRVDAAAHLPSGAAALALWRAHAGDDALKAADTARSGTRRALALAHLEGVKTLLLALSGDVAAAHAQEPGVRDMASDGVVALGITAVLYRLEVAKLCMDAGLGSALKPPTHDASEHGAALLHGAHTDGVRGCRHGATAPKVAEAPNVAT
ncbi:hypothetical protein M885DRAFT_539641 [Pelagophyceae sp. CCMP2097]|nr:hypothetical protein M885DRAFT_539641 [Pelagophyceae sp. CCMP2097]